LRLQIQVRHVVGNVAETQNLLFLQILGGKGGDRRRHVLQVFLDAPCGDDNLLKPCGTGCGRGVLRKGRHGRECAWRDTGEQQ